MTMLDRMRRHKNWLKWSLGLVVLTFIVFYIPDFLQPQATRAGATPREVIVEVDGHDLTAGEFRTRYQEAVRRYRAQFGGTVDDSLLRQLRIDEGILREMIEEQVAVIEAERRNIRVSDEELAQQIMAIPVFNENGQFIGEQRYREILQSVNPPLTIPEFEETTRRSLLVSKLRAALTDWMSVSSAELETAFRERNEKVKLQVVALTADRFRDKVTVSDTDIAARYDAHKAEYRRGEQRKVKYLLLNVKQARLKVIVTPSEVERFYNDNIQRFRTPEQVRASHILLKTQGKDENAVRKQAEEILKQVKGGADFAALASKTSEDDGTKGKGGDLDYFRRGDMVPEFETVAFSLKPGETSDVVKSQHGLHIIRVVDKRAEIVRPLAEVRAQIQEQLLTEKTNEQVGTRSTTLSIQTVADMEKAAVAENTTLQESGLFERNGSSTGPGVAPAVAEGAFTLKEGEVAGPIATPDGPVFVTLVQKKDPYVPSLDEVKDRVRQDTIRDKAAEMSRARANEIAAALAASRDFAATAKAQGLEAKDTELIPRNSALPDVGVSSDVDKVAFTLPVGGTSGVITTNDSAVIVRVTERDEVTPDELRKGREAFRAELLEERRNKFFSAYMSKVREKMTIDMKPEVLRRGGSGTAL